MRGTKDRGTRTTAFSGKNEGNEVPETGTKDRKQEHRARETENDHDGTGSTEDILGA
jgi:hypothetical protein